MADLVDDLRGRSRTSSVCQRIVISSASASSISTRSGAVRSRIVESREQRSDPRVGDEEACAGSPRSGAR
jgi:hypothetical protein